jgi:uncharacterized membrane protein YphA (DoxX/SURF4 family)
MSRRRYWLAVGLLILLAPSLVLAHERFIRHVLKQPLNEAFFRQQAGGVLGMHPDMLQIGLLVTLNLAIFLGAWFLRETLDHLVRMHLLSRLRGSLQRAVHHVGAFLIDRPVRVGWFYWFGEWAVIMFLRSPALVLMFAATNDSLVMPSYPLEPSSATIFKFLQVFLAVLILTQTWLPLAGALIFGTWAYLFRWGPFVAVDALPVVTVGFVYAMSPWQSHKLSITRLNPLQTRLVRIVLGLSFFVLGWTKIYNHDLTAAVGDNYPQIMNDPLVGLFSFGTDPALRRETWVLSFAAAEVMSGFMLMTGVFTRLWCTIMLWVFMKLMLVDFGWDEIPHIYPIGALLAVLTSNYLGTEFDALQRKEREMRMAGPLVKRMALVAAASVAIAFLAVIPMLYFLTFTDRSLLK